MYKYQQNGGHVVLDEEVALSKSQLQRTNTSSTNLRSHSHFEAYPVDDRHHKKGGSGSGSDTAKQMFIVTLVFCDIILVGLQPILVQFSKTGNHFGYNPVCVNLLIEASKATFMFCMIFFKGLSKPRYGKFSMTAIYKMLRKNHLLVIPAILYAINNYLKFVMQLYFEPTTVKMIHNLKVFFIAILSKVLLGRHYSVFQWEALVLLVLGVTVNQLTTGSMHMDIQLSGWIYTSISIGLASLASVFNEKVFKGAYSEHVVIQCFTLYFFGTFFNLVGVCGFALARPSEYNGILYGMSYKTTLIVVCNSCQGVLASLFLKFADTIMKKFSSNIATLVTGLLSATLFNQKLTSNFLIAFAMVSVSLHQFYNLKPGYSVPQKLAKSSSPISSGADLA